MTTGVIVTLPSPSPKRPGDPLGLLVLEVLLLLLLLLPPDGLILKLEEDGNVLEVVTDAEELELLTVPTLPFPEDGNPYSE